MEPHAVAAHARERLGMEIQAVELLRARADGGADPEVWSLLTEHGHFWLVEGSGAVELLRAPIAGAARSVAAAVGHFLELRHQELRDGATPPPAPAGPGAAYNCRVCGVRITPRRRRELAELRICRRCRHAELERERYRSDPEYRARVLARAAAQYRRRREQGSPSARLPGATSAATAARPGRQSGGHNPVTVRARVGAATPP